MKTLSTAVLFAALLLIGCSPEPENVKDDLIGKVNFNLSLSNENGQSRQVLAIPAGSYLHISIETVEGEPVLEDETIEILSFNGNYVSEALEVSVGEYSLTKFMVISPEDEVLYATPMSESPKADLVGNSLPLHFEIAESSSLQLPLEVINVSLLLPDDIGYVSFPFTVTDFFFLSVFKFDSKGSSLTYAKGYIIHNEDTIKSFTAKPEINTVALSNLGNEEFTLLLIKKGYAKYSETFTIESLFNLHENGLLNIQLEPALTFIALPNSYGDDEAEFDFQFTLNYQGELTIDWGNGQIETKTSNSYGASFAHKYGDNSEYFVSITGDIDKITGFTSYYGDGPIKEINLWHLPNLESYRNGFSDCPEVLNFLNNPKLTEIDVSVCHPLKTIKFKNNNVVILLDMDGPNQISTADLDEIITPIYNSVIASGRINGYISIGNITFDEIVGPPSEDAWTKLAILEKDYNWIINIVYDEEKEE
ncbi:hypothetical protein QYS49_33145 [Marivirga salinae]|uniref:Uncharacterized protein n=1 Tax=Marivirga salinarum TaxID=3059078 RepID=A0AA51NE35_9BACT|nr:hypothetical protein [Marivirga sp. BDSF4-3]WMN12295.1 hypothetical protein QYS49_33145 [Marivirga sp. BDSF4-3]